MKILQSLLKRFEHIKDPKESKRKLAADLSESLGTPISAEQIEFKSGTLSFSGISPMIRSLVYMRKGDILESLKKNCADISVKEIR